MTLPFDNLPAGKKIYFVSDFHLGVPNYDSSLEREKKIVRWLSIVEKDAEAIFLMGDVFDFWFEFKHVIPKGFIRLQGKLAEITDKDIPIYWFTGNHDMWIFDYFTKELNIKIFRDPEVLVLNNKKLYIGHGDGLGPGDHIYKAIKKIFRNRFFQEWFRVTPASIGMGIAKFWSNSSRISGLKKEKFLGDKEWLFIYSKELESKTHHDYYIFGHRHLPLDLEINSNSRYINLGEWVNHFTYAVFDGNQVRLLEYKE
ncbi:MAG TPA: UDP-2,3-diacylglucosamine diphosphatase [Cytophagaceae bacterium]|jgi:UDP-2,3-diacylglucosamine hydrolase|nr:UDP-2,3-diacylglucosamine diphosphatase [Cytophagaceae bacterium]